MTAETRADVDDLAARVRTHWQAVALRMSELPIYNAALSVHATEFRTAGDWRIGVVATPWFMNVVAVPGAAVALPRAGEKTTIGLPAGEIEGVVGDMDGLGRIVSASLYSPMDAFDDGAVAIAVAEAALTELFTPPQPEVQPDPPAPPLRREIDRRALLFPMRRSEVRA